MCEHGGVDASTLDSAMHEAVAAIAACGVSPLVRIAANEGWMVKRKICLLLLSTEPADKPIPLRCPGLRR